MVSFISRLLFSDFAEICKTRFCLPLPCGSVSVAVALSGSCIQFDLFYLSGPLSAPLKMRVKRYLLNTSFVPQSTKMRLPRTKELGAGGGAVGCKFLAGNSCGSSCRGSFLHFFLAPGSKPTTYNTPALQIPSKSYWSNSRTEYWLIGLHEAWWSKNPAWVNVGLIAATNEGFSASSTSD